jgi:hypothetical protein
MPGAYLTLASSAPAPNGFTLVGTTTITYRDTHNVVHDSTAKLVPEKLRAVLTLALGNRR